MKYYIRTHNEGDESCPQAGFRRDSIAEVRRVRGFDFRPATTKAK